MCSIFIENIKDSKSAAVLCFQPRFAHCSPHLVFTIQLAVLIALYWQSFYFKLYRNENSYSFLALRPRCEMEIRAVGEWWPPMYIHFKLHLTNTLFFNFQVSTELRISVWTYMCLLKRSVIVANLRAVRCAVTRSNSTYVFAIIINIVCIAVVVSNWHNYCLYTRSMFVNEQLLSVNVNNRDTRWPQWSAILNWHRVA